jgi:hypothetical protein
MVQVLSKFQTIGADCRELHFWDNQCLSFEAETGIVAVWASFQMYAVVYLVSRITRNKFGNVPREFTDIHCIVMRWKW